MNNIKENGEILVQRDYNFLLNLGRQIDLSKSDTYKAAKPVFQKRRPNFNNKNPKLKQRRFQNNNNDRNQVINKGDVQIIQLPMGMERAKSNKTYFDKKKNEYLWTLELVFVDTNGSQTYRTTQTKVPESSTVESSISKNAPSGTLEKTEINYFTFMNIYDSQATTHNHKALVEISKSATIKETLKGKTVLEFPTIYVSPQNSVKGFQICEENSVSDSSDSSDSSDESSDDGDNNNNDNDVLESGKMEESQETQKLNQTKEKNNETSDNQPIHNENTSCAQDCTEKKIDVNFKDTSKITIPKTLDTNDYSPVISLDYDSDSGSEQDLPQESSAKAPQ
ncbi:Bcd1 protein [Saccharomycopsis crataegensis]|uniref:Bcd1 protein n=1 Tax=Saccharomycopsis crataegensis TaxID=43959 RepID=A0AAV5QIL2_9ASCO|nr:Bcd1 protein [Saccharomycopsis crataegensis]